jgi:thiosulfate/3-mercaptopyruvate sulfurtransferase
MPGQGSPFRRITDAEDQMEGLMRRAFLAGTAFAAVLAGGALAVFPSNQAVAASQASVAVTTDWLAAHLGDPNLVLMHIGDEAEYRAGHIPGARFVRLSDLSVNADGRSLEMPSAAVLRQRLQALGVSGRSRVVVYFGSDRFSPTTRVLFTLQTAGLGARASLLDGGMPKWRREGRTVTATATPTPKPGALEPLQLRPTVVDAAFVQAHANQPGYVLIDARAPVFYSGLQAGGAPGHERRGHIPGARSLPFTSVTNDDLTLKPPAQLLAMFRDAGVQPGDRVIAYCHIGQQATAVLLAACAAGVDAVLYDGSFEDWSLRDLPVEP